MIMMGLDRLDPVMTVLSEDLLSKTTKLINGTKIDE